MIFSIPCIIAWHNINVINSIGQAYTLSSLLFVSFFASAFGALVLYSGNWNNFTKDQDNLQTFAGAFVFLLGGIIALFAAMAVLFLRTRKVGCLGIRLVNIILAFPRNSDLFSIRNIRPQRPLLGSLLIMCAAIVLIGVDFLPLGAMQGQSAYRIVTQISQFGLLLILMARSYLQPTATSVLDSDGRSPILLLRSFIDDEKISYTKTDQSFVDTSLESRLADHFTNFGPFIAVGNPSDKLPVIGAARANLTDEEWQDRVKSWIGRSSLILMMAGITDWVDWELEQVLTYCAIDRLIICFPQVGKQKWNDKTLRKFPVNMEARVNRLRKALEHTPWSTALSNLSDPQSLRSLVFNPGGSITAIRAHSRNRNAYHLAVVISHWLIRERLPAELRPTSNSGDALEYHGLSNREIWFCSVLFILYAIAILILGFKYLYVQIALPAAIGLTIIGLSINPFVSRLGARVIENRWIKYGMQPLAALLVACSISIFFLFEYGTNMLAELPNTDPVIAVRLIKPGAYAGLAKARYLVGLCYLEGTGVPKDYNRGRALIEEAAWGGDRNAMADMGDFFHWGGDGVLQDASKALAWYQAAARAGEARAMAVLGLAYQNGDLGVQVDFSKAAAYYISSAESGFKKANVFLGLLYIDGNGVQQDFARAKALLEKPAAENDPQAAFGMALMFAHGWGMARNPKEAARLYEIAAGGIEVAKVNLAVLLYDGDGLDAARERAHQLLVDAAKSSDAEVRRLAEQNLKDRKWSSESPPQPREILEKDKSGRVLSKQLLDPEGRAVLVDGIGDSAKYRYANGDQPIGILYFDERGGIIPIEVEVQEVVGGSTAAKIGLLPGDRLLAYGAVTLCSIHQLVHLTSASDGKPKKLTYRRGKSVFTSLVPAGRIGVNVTNVRASGQTRKANCD